MILYMGFDIGDAESIIAFAKGDDSNVQNATMPGKNAAGMAIPTMYGFSKAGDLQLADAIANDGSDLTNVAVNFKRCPSDLVSLDDVQKNQLMALDDEHFWEDSALEGIREYARKLNTFVEIVLEHPDFVKYLSPMLDGCSECKVVVGYPTRWTEFDKRVYGLMLRHGIMGEPTLRGVKLTLNLFPESRAAFLYVRDAYKLKVSANTDTGIIDVGSSTIDISVMRGNDSRNFVYDKGSNFLGVRSIDYLIMEYCMEKLRSGDDSDLFEDIFAIDTNGKKKNPSAWDHALINCRFAKERLFSSSVKDTSKIKTFINILDFNPIKLTYNTLIDDICNRPIAPILKKYCALSETDYKWISDMGWREAFQAFLAEQKVEMAACGVQLSQIFFTGSASRMPFVKEIAYCVFNEIDSENELKNDTNPSCAIANGLARVGVSEDKAVEFMTDIKRYISGHDGLQLRVKKRIPDLISDISMPILDVMEEKVIVATFEDWQLGKLKTVNDLLKKIEDSLSDETYMAGLLKQDKKCSEAIRTWVTDKLGNDIANDLHGFAVKYRVTEFSAADLNAFSFDFSPTYHGGKIVDGQIISVNPIQNVISTIVGIVTAIVAPFIIGVIIGLTYLISESVYVSLVVALIECPEPVFSKIIFMIAIGAGMGVKAALKQPKNKKKLESFMNERDIPVFSRKLVKVDILRKEFRASKPEIAEKMKDKLNGTSNIDKQVKEIAASVSEQVQKKADEIRYVIISR